MSCPSLCYSSCPSPVSTVNVTQNFLHLSDGDAIVEPYNEVVTGTTVTLPYTPLVGFEPSVHVNGLLQREGLDNHYTILDNTVTFTSALDGDAVTVTYAHLV